MPAGKTLLGVPSRRLALPPDADEPDGAYRSALDWVWSFSPVARTPEDAAARRAQRMPRMAAILHELGDPHRAYPSIVVGGTKGKGSVVAMASSCLSTAGLRTGSYTSPHLINWRERTCLDGTPIATHEVLRLVGRVRAAVERLRPELGRPSTFEVGTALAFLYFAEVRTDVAVVEVGVGGRHDATNVLDPLVAVVTPIGYDHLTTLGSTLTAIATEKAGILRAGRPAVISPQPAEARSVLERTAERLGSRLVRVGVDWRWEPVDGQTFDVLDAESSGQPERVRLPLLGDHQRDNAVAAVAALRELGRVWPRGALAYDTIRAGLGAVDWPGRLQVVGHDPLIVLDGAHNASSARAIEQAVRATFPFRRLHLVLGLTAGKDAPGVVQALAPLADSVLVTRSHHERSEDPARLYPLVRQARPRARVECCPDVADALDRALRVSGADDLVLVAGSLFLVGEALLWERSRP